MTAPFLGPSFGLHAFGKITGASGALTNPVNMTNSVRNGAGDYTLTLGSEIDATTRHSSLTVRGATDGKAVLEPAGEADGTVNVKTFNTAGAAADVDFEIAVFRTAVPS